MDLCTCAICIIVCRHDHICQQCRRAPVSVLRPDDVSPAACAALGLAGEEGGGEVVVKGKVAGAEVVAEERRAVYGAACHLLEEHQHHAVDPGHRSGSLVAEHLVTCMQYHTRSNTTFILSCS
jgi:hypothetical protein